MLSVTANPLLYEVALPAAAAGIAIGALLAWLIARRRHNVLIAERDALQQKITHEERLREEREAAFELANARLEKSFAALASQSLQTNSDTFLKLAEQRMSVQNERAKAELSEREKAVASLVKPIQDALKASQEQIHALEKSRSEAYGGIREQLEAMQASQKNLTQETQNLVKALRRPEVRGRWGEITLRRLVELAGMVEHCDFQEQVHTPGESQTIRPDLIIRMPNERELVVDVKTPLDAYLEAVEANNDADAKAGLVRHARGLRDHVKMLSGKAYWSQFARSPEFVILFIPGDQFLSAALNEDPELIEFALKQQIILATPTSFIALLKAVAYGWRQLALAENAEEIRKHAETLHDRLGTWVDHMSKLGRQLNSSVDAYNKAVGSLERSVLPGARRFKELGVTKKELTALEQIERSPRALTPHPDDVPSSDDDESPKQIQ
jgi:DNA recombination protein RmuC